VFFLANGLILRNFRPACLPLALKAATFVVVAYVYRHVLCDVTPSALAFGVPSHQLCATQKYIVAQLTGVRKKLHHSLMQCFSNFFVCRTLLNIEIFHGIPLPVFELTI
jgi:hypothetical protein